MKLKIFSAILLLSVACGGVFAAEKAEGRPCGPCRKYAEDPANAGFVFRCVSASQPGGPEAPNLASMKGCGKYYSELKAEGAGCAGAWCLHGWLINRAASELDPVRPKTRDYYLAPAISPCVSYLEEGL